MFDKVVMFRGLAMEMLNLALSAGSSKQGNARRASVGWNCVVAIHLKVNDGKWRSLLNIEI